MQVLDVMFGASDLDDAPGLEVSESSAAGAKSPAPKPIIKTLTLNPRTPEPLNP